MTPKEKAKELVAKYASFSITTLGCGYEKGNPCIITNVMFKDSAKNCALISVNEIINANPHSNPLNTDVYSTMEWWQEVKEELEKL